MGAHDQLRTALARVEELGRHDRGTRNPIPEVAELWRTAGQFAPDMFRGDLPGRDHPVNRAGGVADELTDAYNQGRYREPGDSDERRLAAAVEQGSNALWAAFATAYPEIETGDFGPGETMAIEQAIREAFELMLYYNRPPEGIAETLTDARDIIDRRRAAHVERLTPMATVVAGLSPRALGDVARALIETYIGETMDARDFTPLTEKTAKRVLRENAERRFYGTDGVAEIVGVLVDLVGDYRTAKTLIAASGGLLCDARCDDGDPCGAEFSVVDVDDHGHE